MLRDSNEGKHIAKSDKKFSSKIEHSTTEQNTDQPDKIRKR